MLSTLLFLTFSFIFKIVGINGEKIILCLDNPKIINILTIVFKLNKDELVRFSVKSCDSMGVYFCEMNIILTNNTANSETSGVGASEVLCLSGRRHLSCAIRVLSSVEVEQMGIKLVEMRGILVGNQS